MSTTTVAQALANLRATGAKVSPVFYDHNPRRAKSKGGPQWHYSITAPAGTVLYKAVSGSDLDSPHGIVKATDAHALVNLLERITQHITETQEV